jgi:hypothetical protein
MIEGNDLLGDGVNIAARIQAIALPGGINISGSIYDQIRNNLELSFRSLGEQKYKNIPQAVRTYSVVDINGAGKFSFFHRLSSRKNVLAAVAVFCAALAGGDAVYGTALIRSAPPVDNYSGQVCYGPTNEEKARCYFASGIISRGTFTAKVLARDVPGAIVVFDGIVAPSGEIKIKVDLVRDKDRFPRASLVGTVKDDHLEAAGTFREGRTISLNWKRDDIQKNP